MRERLTAFVGLSFLVKAHKPATMADAPVTRLIVSMPLSWRSLLDSSDPIPL